MSFTLMQRSAYAVEFVCAAFIVGFCYGIVGVEFEMTVTFIVLLVCLWWGNYSWAQPCTQVNFEPINAT